MVERKPPGEAIRLACDNAARSRCSLGSESVLYGRMKTGDEAEGTIYKRTMLAFAAHYGFVRKACRPYRAKTKGKVERRSAMFRRTSSLPAPSATGTCQRY